MADYSMLAPQEVSAETNTLHLELKLLLDPADNDVHKAAVPIGLSKDRHSTLQYSGRVKLCNIMQCEQRMKVEYRY